MPFEKLFPSQQPNEKILLVVREHWFRLAFKVLIIVVLSLLPVIFKLLLVDTDLFTRSQTAIAISQTVFGLYYLVLLVALFVVFALYYLNIHIVSEERVVDIDQVGLLFHQVSELNVEKIEDVTSQTAGIFGNFLNYGTVYIQTAGTVERFEFNNVAEPEKVASIILELYEKREKAPREVVVDNPAPTAPVGQTPSNL
ncbi:MAG TPA: PH domain-containing protein [Patescibacteria group bacterium]|jgi:hypothetical protein|nr:PH domain-containing protein [Patescibacteria group bacterium]